MIKETTKTKCLNCGKDILNKEAVYASIIRRKKLEGTDPRIFDVWFEDWCEKCATDWKPYIGD